MNIVNFEIISIIDVGTFKFKDQCLIPQLKISLQGKTIREGSNQSVKLHKIHYEKVLTSVKTINY